MKVPRTKLAHAIADKTLQSGVTQEYAKEVAAYLLSEGRVGELDSLLRDVQADWAKKGYVEVIANSAFPLTDETKAEIASRMKLLFPQAKDVVVTEVEDKAVIGGVQISLADAQLDLSVEAKLNRFKQLTGAGKE